MFAWTEYLDLARALAAGSKEAEHRSAVSRAYYAAFHRARALLQAKTGQPLSQVADSHAAVWRGLEAKGRACARIGAIGKRLKQHRVNADYEDAMERASEVASVVLGEAATLLQLVEQELRSVPPRPTSNEDDEPPLS